MAISLFAAFSVLLLDRFTKVLAASRIPLEGSLAVLPGIFHITLIHNTGTAFGMLKGCNGLFIILALIVIVYITAYLRNNNTGDRVLNISLGLIIGGAAGNLVDRVKFGYVIDFLDFRVWPVFNVADSAITIGAALLAWRIFMRKNMGNPKHKTLNPE